MNDLPPIGSWVRVCTNTTPGSLTIIGLVLAHRENPPRAVVMNMHGGVAACQNEIEEVLTGADVPSADVTEQVWLTYRGFFRRPKDLDAVRNGEQP